MSPRGSKRPIAIFSDRQTTVSAMLSRLGPDAHAALSDGRIFADGKRIERSDQRIEPGQQVVMYAVRQPAGDLEILGERDGIIAVHKPAAMASVPDRQGRAGSLVEAIALRFGPCARKWEPTSRLDIGVSGVVLLAMDADARRWLVQARQEGRYLRHYVAIAERAPSPANGLWSESIGRASDPCLRRVGGRDAKTAQTQYMSIGTTARGPTLLAVEPHTGRTHQIRVHAAHAGSPLLGDGAYGGRTRVTEPSGAVVGFDRIALHAAWVEVPTGPRGAMCRFEAPIDQDLYRIWALFGGDEAAWQRALVRC